MKTIRLHPSGHEVKAQEGDTVLMALERAGYALPNNCRAGACGECKVRVTSGQFDQGIVLDMALSQDERKQGYGLMCMAKPLSAEMVIEWGTADAKPTLFPPHDDQPYILTERIWRTPSILELRLRPLGAAMRYWPGQYVQVRDPDKRLPRRCYSLATPPRADGELCLQVTRVENGRTSVWLHDGVDIGSTVCISGPFGTFIGDPSVDAPVLCLAAGSGLAPILALTEAALRRGFSQPVTLMFSARTAADLYESGLLRYWSAKYSNFTYLPTLTREAHAGLTGRIPTLLPARFGDLSDHSVFIAGGPSFVDDCKQAVLRLRAPERHIHTEGFHDQP